MTPEQAAQRVRLTVPLTRSVCTDYSIPAGQPGRYVITEEYRDGFIVVARFKRLDDAKRYLGNMVEGR
jgi:hypothetical protein